MREPQTTLRDIQRAVEAQDAQLQASHREASGRSRAAPILLPQNALERLRDACASPVTTIRTTTVCGGIHC
jgi:hypothetical protein